MTDQDMVDFLYLLFDLMFTFFSIGLFFGFIYGAFTRIVNLVSRG